MKKGKLKFYNRFQEYGLIIDFETGKEYRVNPKGMQDCIVKDGENVVFEIVQSKNGVKAVDIRSAAFKLNS